MRERAKGQESEAEFRNAECAKMGDKGALALDKRQGQEGKKRLCGEQIPFRKPHSTKHKRKLRARILEEIPDGISFIAGNAGQSKLLGRFKKGSKKEG